MDSADIKQIAHILEADLCGIAAVDRFGEAPNGHHPRIGRKRQHSATIQLKSNAGEMKHD